MTYKEIISDNIKNRKICPKWWMKYAFHMTDVTNAASIIRDEK